MAGIKIGGELNDILDFGEAIVEGLEKAKAERRALNIKRVNVDFPVWMVEALDRHADHRGVTRQSLIKMWLADRLVTEEKTGSTPKAGR